MAIAPHITSPDRHPWSIHLESFAPEQAATIVSWVRTPQELLWLAPSTQPPLTEGDVCDWLRPGGRALVVKTNGVDTTHETPEAAGIIAYGETNPMKLQKNHLWLGHVIIRPDLRGTGLGRRFIEALVDHAFHRQDAQKLSLVVFPGNAAALACYHRVGFKFTGDEYHRLGRDPRRHRLFRLDLDRSSFVSSR